MLSIESDSDFAVVIQALIEILLRKGAKVKVKLSSGTCSTMQIGR